MYLYVNKNDNGTNTSALEEKGTLRIKLLNMSATKYRSILGIAMIEGTHKKNGDYYNTKQDTCRKVWSFSKPLRVIVQMGGC